MAKSLVRIMCWGNSHVTDLPMTVLQARKLEADIPKLKKVCPNCKPDNKPIVVTRGPTILFEAKAYSCEKGHLSLLAPLGDMVHVKFGPSSDDFINVKAPLEELPNLLAERDIACNHVVDGQLCDCKLVPLDDFKLEKPSAPGIKTRMLVGDLWDRHGIEPVRTGGYDSDGTYRESRSQKANENRLERMRRDRNTPAARQPGTRIKKATKTDYGHRNKSSVNPDKLE
jgi:hypothetical protein